MATAAEPQRSHVVVVGAGVLGLSCALQLAQRGIAVTVLANHLPGDWDVSYASPRAGAHFRPVPIKTDQDAFENVLMRESYDEFKRLSNTPDTKPAGVSFIPAVEYFDVTPGKEDLDMFAAWPGFRQLAAHDLPAVAGVTSGLTYDAWVVNSPVYLKWLQRESEILGVLFSRHTLSAVEEATFIANEIRPDLSQPTVIVNASGMGFADNDCFPSRGQFLLLPNSYDKTISHHSADGHSTVIIPRPLGGGSIVGGTKEPHNWSPVNSNAAIDEISTRILAICPDLVKPTPTQLAISEAYIGRRPMRKGGLRLELEEISTMKTASNGMSNDEFVVTVVHCYGAGPSGYKIGWGAAKRVCDMASKALGISE